MLKVCLPTAELLGGGASAFYRNLRAYCSRKGIAVTERLDDNYELLFTNSWVTPYRAVLQAKRTHPEVKVLHRVDGSALDYGRHPIADLRQTRVNLLADVTVFQSRYGKYATTLKYRVIRRDGPVIHNPVDVDRFRPEGEQIALPGTIKVCHVTHSTNPRKGGPLLYSLARANPRVTFILTGRYEALPGLENLHYLGYANWEMLPRVLRSCDVFLMLAENEACPNVVLEAMASGLPVLYRQSGGTPEIVGECGRAVESETFAEVLAWALDHRRELAQAARRRAVEQFAPDVIFPRYFEAIGEARRRSVPSAWHQLTVLQLAPRILWGLARWRLAQRHRGVRPRGLP